MKSLLVSIFLTAGLIVATASYSQSLTTQARETVHLEKRTAQLLSPALSLRVTIDTDKMDVSDGKDHTFNGTITNTADTALYLFFRRYQVVPNGWTSSVCFGSSCYANTVDSMGQVFGARQSQKLIIHAVPALEEKPDSCTIFLTLGSASGNPADTTMIAVKAYFWPGPHPIIFKLDDSKVRWSVIGGGQPHLFTPNFQNLSGDPVMYHFLMQPERMPAGWNTVFCVVDNCPGGTDESHQFDPVYGDNYSEKVTIKLTSPALTEKDSAIFYFSVHPQTQNPADSAIYRFVAILNDYSFSHPAKSAFAGPGEHRDSDSFHNYSGQAATWHYSLKSVKPTGWTSRFCVGDSCSNGQEVRNSFSADGTPASDQPVNFYVNSLAVSQRDSAVLYLHVSKESNPSDSATYRVVEYVDPQDAIAEPTPQRSGIIAVTNAWPNPVVGFSRLNLEIVTDNPGHAVAVVYDMAGVEKAVLDLGELSGGINRIQLGSFGVPSGDYIIRVNQGEVSSQPVLVNCLK
jgi:hypothetical protein